MKKTKLLLLAAGLTTAMLTAGCGQKSSESGTPATDSNIETTTSGDTEESTPAETVSADDPELKALAEQGIPEAPKLNEMGSISLPDIKEIEVSTAPEEVVTEEELNRQIEALLSADLETVDEASAEGDTVNIDYVGTIDGTAFDGGTDNGYDLKLGSGTFIPGFEDQLVGSRAGDKVTVKVNFPEDYGNADLAGKPAEFAVTVNAVKRAPELTDEWVKSYDETDAQTVEEFKEDMRTQLQASYDYSYHATIQQDALMQIVDNASIELSDAMKEYGTAYVIQTQLQQMKSYGFDLASMINMYGMTVDEFKEEMSAEGEEYAKQYFVVQQIAADQDITLTDELVEKLAESMSSISGRKYTRLELFDQFGQETVEKEAVNSAVMNYIESQVKLKVDGKQGE